MMSWLKSRSITVKLMGLLLLSSVIGIVLVASMVWWFVEREFDSFIVAEHQENFISDVSEYYIVFGTWDGVDAAMRARSNQQGQPPPNNNNPPPAPPDGQPNRDDNNPPPPQQTNTSAFLILAASACSAISKPTVPWPAIT